MRYGISTRSAKRSNYSKSKKYTPKPVKKIVKSALKSNFNKKVMAVVHRNEETKIAQPLANNDVQIVPYQLAGAGIDSIAPTSFDIIPLLNGIPVGSGQGARVGNQIDNVRITLKGSIANISASTRPFMVKMIVFRDKKNQFAPFATPDGVNNLSDFLQYGNGVINPQNSAIDMVRYINRDRYTVYATRMFKLGSSTSSSNPNNDFSVQRYFKIDLSKHISKIRYSESNDTGNNPGVVTPQNLWVTFLVCYADGTEITFGETPSYPTVEITMDAVCTYKDV